MAEGIIGLTTGFVGLATLFSTCVDCFRLVQVYQQRHGDFDTLQTMLDNQQFLLMAWGKACGLMDGVSRDSPFEDPLSAARNSRVENTLESIQSLLTNTDTLRNRYKLRPYRQARGAALAIGGVSPSPFERAFQGSKDFWNRSLQRKSRIAGAILWTVNDKDRFSELVTDLSRLIDDLNNITKDGRTETTRKLIVDYELEIIGDEGSLEAIAEASVSGDIDDTVSSAAQRQLQRVKERSTIVEGVVHPGDSISEFSPSARLLEILPEIPEQFPLADEMTGLDETQQTGIYRVQESDWRKIKTRRGIIPWLPTLLVSLTAAADTQIPSTNSESTSIASHQGFNQVLGQAIVPSSVRPSRLAINSPLLVDGLRKIIGPGLTSEQNVLIHPFKPLILYETEIRAALAAAVQSCAEHDGHAVLTSTDDTRIRPDSLQPDEDTDRARVLALRLREEFACLVSFMNSDIADLFHVWSDLDETVPFDCLWTVFTPGDIVIRQIGTDDVSALLIIHVTGGRKVLDIENNTRTQASRFSGSVVPGLERAEQKCNEDPSLQTLFVLHYVRLTCNGTSIGPVSSLLWVAQYNGRRTIRSLPVLPLKLCDPSGSLKKRLFSRGQRFIDYMQCKHIFYSGEVLPEFLGDHSPDCQVCSQRSISETIESHVVVDHDAAASRLHQLGCSLRFDFIVIDCTQYDPREVFEVIQCSDPLCTQCSDVYNDCRLDVEVYANTTRAFSGLLEPVKLKGLDSATIGTLFCMLLPFHMAGYSLQHHEWYALLVDHGRKVVPDSSMLDDLVVPTSHKQIIRAFIDSRVREQVTKADNAMGWPHKAAASGHKSALLLFHGPAGVGKTTTAEAIAAHLNQPTLVLSAEDLGTTVQDLKERLPRFVSWAGRWKCVVVVHGLDALLLSRSRALLSTFVRQMDSFSGLLIMISDRTQAFDEVAASMFHLILAFPPLDLGATMSVWKSVLRQIKNREQIEVEIDDIVNSIDNANRSAQSSVVSWNGRKIKNACEAALALARFEREAVGRKHVGMIISASQSSRTYLQRPRMSAIPQHESRDKAQSAWEVPGMVEEERAWSGSRVTVANEDDVPLAGAEQWDSDEDEHAQMDHRWPEGRVSPAFRDRSLKRSSRN